MAHIVAAGDLARRLSCISTFDRFLSLMRCELRSPSEFDAAFRHSSLSSFHGSCANEFPLELGETTQNGQHQPAMHRRAVGPRIMERTEARALLGDLRDDVQKVTGRTREPVQTRHARDVAFAERGEHSSQLGAIIPCAARRLLEDFLRPGGAQFGDLTIEGLRACRHASIANNHRSIMHRKYETLKARKISAARMVRNS